MATGNKNVFNKEGEVMTNTNFAVTNVDFEKYLTDNMQMFVNVLPKNPALTTEDEWRTDDYSDYEQIKSDEKDGG